MVRLVADTHAILWRLTSPATRGRAAQRAFEAADSGRWLCCVPAIVLVEVGIKDPMDRMVLAAARVSGA